MKKALVVLVGLMLISSCAKKDEGQTNVITPAGSNQPIVNNVDVKVPEIPVTIGNVNVESDGFLTSTAKIAAGITTAIILVSLLSELPGVNILVRGFTGVTRGQSVKQHT